MPGKKKRQGSRPTIQAQDSMRADIEAARSANLHTISSNESGDLEGAGEGLDLADQLLATLDARDKAAKEITKTSLSSPEPPGKSRTGWSGESGHSSTGDASSSTSPRRGPGEMLMHAGEKIFGHHSPKSPPPITSDDSGIDGSLSKDMAQKGSIRERIFGSSPNVEDHSSPNGGARKVSRQKIRKVSQSDLRFEVRGLVSRLDSRICPLVFLAKGTDEIPSKPCRIGFGWPSER